MPEGDAEAQSMNGERLPPLFGHLSSEHETKVRAGGSGPKQFAAPSEVRSLFGDGLDLLEAAVFRNERRYAVSATVGCLSLRPKAIAKSHRHSELFSRLQVIGVDGPGEMLVLVTQMTIQELRRVLAEATDSYMRYLSPVGSIAEYVPEVDIGDDKSVVTLFDGTLDDESSFGLLGADNLSELGALLGRYGGDRVRFVAQGLPRGTELRSMPWVRKVRPIIRLSAQESPQLGADLTYFDLSAANGVPRTIVGVFDSGIDSSHPWLEQLVARRESHVPPRLAKRDHGTLVAALAATGGNLGSGGVHLPPPCARLVDVEVLGSGSASRIDEDDFLTQLEDAVSRMGPTSDSLPEGLDEPVRIWNLSVNAAQPADAIHVSDMGKELDRLSTTYHVLFVVSAGNYEGMPVREWVRGGQVSIVPNRADRVAPPADAALSLTVGSLSHTNSGGSAAPSDCPSPFSRRGPGPALLVKPDVVHYGGTCDRRRGCVGPDVQGPGPNGTWQRSCIGTSFASPRVVAELAKVLPQFPTQDVDLLRVLALLGCQCVGDHSLESRESVDYYGFGVLCDTSAVMSCAPHEAIVVLGGDLRPGFPLCIEFPFPSCLVADGRYRGLIRMALAYSPVLSPDKGSEYCQTNVSAKLGRLLERTSDGRAGFKNELLLMPRETGGDPQYESELLKSNFKWSPCKLYESNLRMRVRSNDMWQLRVELLLRKELEAQRSEVRQPFWLAISLQDPLQSPHVYDELRVELSRLGIAAPIRMAPIIRL